MTKISDGNLLNQFEIASGNALKYDFTASEKHLAYAIYDKNTLYTQIYDIKGNTDGENVSLRICQRMLMLHL